MSHTLRMTCFALALAALSGLPGCEPDPGPATAGALYGRWDVLIDVRVPEAYATGAIPGAVNLPLATLASTVGRVAPNRAARIAVYCKGGAEAARAKAILESMGYTRVESLGGIDEASRRLGVRPVRPVPGRHSRGA